MDGHWKENFKINTCQFPWRHVDFAKRDGVMAFISFNCYKNKKGKKKNEFSKQNDTISWSRRSRPLVGGGNVGNVAIIVRKLRQYKS